MRVCLSREEGKKEESESECPTVRNIKDVTEDQARADTSDR